MKDYIDYDEEQFFYMDKKSGNISTGATDAVGSVLGSIIYGIIRFLTRADLVSSCLVALVIYLLTYKNEWVWYSYAIGAVLIIGVSFVLQHKFVVFRILYSVLACVAIAILATIIIGYDSTMRMYQIFGISFFIASIWALLSWKFNKKATTNK